MELHFDAPVLVRKNLFARWAYHNSSLRAGHDRLLSHARRAERQSERDAVEAVDVVEHVAARAVVVRRETRFVRDARKHVIAIGVVVPFECEFAPRGEMAAGASAAN